MGQVAIHTTPWNSTCRGASSWRAFTKTCGSVTCARNWRFVLNAQTGKTALHTTRSRSACCAASSWRDAVAKCLQARPVGTTPIVAWHEVPGTKCLGKRPSKEPSRRVRYDRAQLVPEVFLVEMCANHRIGAHTCTNHTVPYGTAVGGGAVPGTSCQATIARSLRDISQQALANATGWMSGHQEAQLSLWGMGRHQEAQLNLWWMGRHQEAQLKLWWMGGHQEAQLSLWGMGGH